MPPNINGSNSNDFSNGGEAESPSTTDRNCHTTDNDDEVNEGEVTRVAMRIAMSAFAKLEAQSSGLSEFEIMQYYIELCPYVSKDSPAMEAALKGIKEVTQLSKEKINNVQRSIDVTEKDALSRKLNFQKKSVPKKKKRGLISGIFCVLGYIVRTMMLDAPLALCFAAYLGAVWTHRLHTMYLGPQILALEWDDERSFDETTYYKRVCDASDQSAFLGEELFLSEDATPEEAYEHQLIHGMTVFPSVLTDETATNLRDFIISRNHNLTEAESIYVIEGDNRFSFGLGTEEPSVAKAMTELATNERFKPALEKILGRNPALIEMTAITSTYGAVAQYWHDDVIATASAMQFGRAFGPSYSIFVQLQNTTKEMGATQGCPGTHFCATGSMEKFCDRNGIQLVGKDGYWKAGDGMLMNMNVWHRGHAHIDPEGADRVMLILTFVPRPRTHAESRQMSQGITFSLRWDMWGHTLYDLADANKRMTQPWATLRALGLYKPQDVDWGIDFVTSGSHRIASEDNGFRPDELEEYLEEGGFELLPKFLHGEIGDEDGWEEYYLSTVIRCEDFFKKANVIALVAYCILQVIVLIFSLIFTRGSKATPFRRYWWAAIRLLITHGIIYGLYKAALSHVDNTQWARDIVAKRRYTNPFIFEDLLYDGPSVYPHREDILVETKYKLASLAMYNDFIMAHPGNREWKKLLKTTAPLYVSYAGLPKVFREQLSDYMVSIMESQERRFLFQSGQTHWIKMYRDDVLDYSTRQLKIHSNPVLHHVHRELEFIISELRTGHLREKVMTHYDFLPYLAEFSDRLLDLQSEVKVDVDLQLMYELQSGEAAPKPRSIKLLHRWIQLSPPKSNSRFVRRKPNLKVGRLPMEPEPGAWRTVGDIIEARWKGKSKSGPKWYYGELLDVHSNGWHKVKFGDERVLNVKPEAIRAYLPFHERESLDVLIGEEYEGATVVRQNGDDTVDLVTLEGESLTSIPITHVRRFYTKKKKRQKTQYY